MLQIDDPSMVTRYGYPNPSLSVGEYQKHGEMRVEELNRALANVPGEKISFHLCWGSQHSPHTTDLSLRRVIGLILTVNASAIYLETADAGH